MGLETNKVLTPQRGMSAVLIHTLAVCACLLLWGKMKDAYPPFRLLAAISCLVALRGYFVVRPGQARVLLLHGQYKGHVAATGFHWVNPFFGKLKCSLTPRYASLPPQILSDQAGLELTIQAKASWKITAPKKAYAHLDKIEDIFVYYLQTSLAAVLSSLSYEQSTDAERAIKGNHTKVEQLSIARLQGFLDEFGIQVLEVSLLQLSPPPAYVQQQQAQGKALQAHKNWVLQSLPLSDHLLKQFLGVPNMPPLTNEQKQAVLKEFALVLCSNPPKLE